LVRCLSASPHLCGVLWGGALPLSLLYGNGFSLPFGQFISHNYLHDELFKMTQSAPNSSSCVPKLVIG
jgi:hypothetical protein